MSDEKTIHRRDLLKTALAGTGALGLGGRVLAAPAGPARGPATSGPGAGRRAMAPDPTMPLVTFGKTGEKISRLVAGTALPLSVNYIAKAYGLGVTAWDLADCYNGGNSERVMGRFLEATGVRKDLFLISKSDRHDPAGFVQTLDQSLERMRTDTLDLFFLHNASDPAVLNAELKATVERLKKQGKIRFFGFSSHAPKMVEVLEKAAQIDWVDGILFKYNFHSYDDARLNRAIDALAKANVGMIAMKTQGSSVSFADNVRPWQDKGLTKPQAVLKAVWADQRIPASVSAMKGYGQLEENVKAAKDLTELGASTLQELRRYGKATSNLHCRGCEQYCTAELERPVAVADTLRMLMYHDSYGERSKARRLFRQIPRSGRDFRGVDFAPATAACPYGLDVGGLMSRAADVFEV